MSSSCVYWYFIFTCQNLCVHVTVAKSHVKTGSSHGRKQIKEQNSIFFFFVVEILIQVWKKSNNLWNCPVDMCYHFILTCQIMFTYKQYSQSHVNVWGTVKNFKCSILSPHSEIVSHVWKTPVRYECMWSTCENVHMRHFILTCQILAHMWKIVNHMWNCETVWNSHVTNQTWCDLMWNHVNLSNVKMFVRIIAACRWKWGIRARKCLVTSCFVQHVQNGNPHAVKNPITYEWKCKSPVCKKTIVCEKSNFTCDMFIKDKCGTLFISPSKCTHSGDCSTGCLCRWGNSQLHHWKQVA